MTKNPDLLIPFSPEAEEAVLGALLINPSMFPVVARLLQPSNFFLLRHRWIFEAMLALDKAKTEWDYLVVGRALEEAGHLDDLGGVPHLMRLINNTPTSVHAEVYAHIIKRAARRRRLLEASDKLRVLALDESKDIEAVLAEASEEIWPVLLSPKQESRLTTYGAALNSLYDTITTKRRMGILSGMEPLDELFYGWRPKKLYVVGARTGLGKTQFLLALALGMVLRGARILFVTLEMDAEEIALRLSAAHVGVDSQSIIRNEITDEQAGKFTQLLIDSQPMEFFIDDSPGQTPQSIAMQARYLKATVGLDAVFIDYIQLVGGTGRMTDYERVSAAAYGAKIDVAMGLDVAVITAAQISREVDARKDKRPLLTDLKESGKIEEAADVVVFPYREDYYKPSYIEVKGKSVLNWVSQVEVSVAKHRGGALGEFIARFDRAANTWDYL